MTDTPTPTKRTPEELDALDAMTDAEEAWLNNGDSDYSEENRRLAMLRAVPLDYCVQRAINEGGGALMFDGPLRDLAIILTGEPAPGWEDDQPIALYRLASENLACQGPFDAG